MNYHYPSLTYPFLPILMARGDRSGYLKPLLTKYYPVLVTISSRSRISRY